MYRKKRLCLQGVSTPPCEQSLFYHSLFALPFITRICTVRKGSACRVRWHQELRVPFCTQTPMHSWATSFVFFWLNWKYICKYKTKPSWQKTKNTIEKNSKIIIKKLFSIQSWCESWWRLKVTQNPFSLKAGFGWLGVNGLMRLSDFYTNCRNMELPNWIFQNLLSRVQKG